MRIVAVRSFNEFEGSYLVEHQGRRYYVVLSKSEESTVTPLPVSFASAVRGGYWEEFDGNPEITATIEKLLSEYTDPPDFLPS